MAESKRKKARFGDLKNLKPSNNLVAPEVAPKELASPEESVKITKDVQFNIRITKSDAELIRLICFKKRITKIAFFDECLSAYLEKNGIDKDGKNL